MLSGPYKLHDTAKVLEALLTAEPPGSILIFAETEGNWGLTLMKDADGEWRTLEEEVFAPIEAAEYVAYYNEEKWPWVVM